MSSFLTLNINEDEECEEDISDCVDIFLSKEIFSQLSNMSNMQHWPESHEKSSRKLLTILIVFANYGSINRGKCLYRSLKQTRTILAIQNHLDQDSNYKCKHRIQ